MDTNGGARPAGRHGATPLRWLSVGLVACTLLALGCRSAGRAGDPNDAPRATSAATPVTAAAPAPIDGAGVVIGAPTVIDNLTVFPVLASAQLDVGPITTLEAALNAGAAEVKELDSMGEPNSADREDAARVDTLVIQNKGDVSIYVLAGTVVKGGKQDRQIAQDFVVEAKSQVPIDAFCVEHGRWNASRDGEATAGKFVSSGELALSDVRAAAQYEKDQSKVWNKVAEVNLKHGKAAETGTLSATLDDVDVKRKIASLATRVRGALDAAEPKDRMVGLAYAIDGRVRAVRWFAHRRIFELFSERLAAVAALDALTAQNGKAPKAPPPLAPRDVLAQMRDVDASAAQQADTAASNVNEYRKSERGYGSAVKLKPKTSASGAPAARPAPTLSKDYLFY